MSPKNAKDFWSGIMFAVIGVLAVVLIQEHELGTASRMGPAYFPTLLGAALAALGAFIALRGWRRPDADGDSGEVEPFSWRILALVLGSVLLFSLVLEHLGLMLSIAVMVGVSAVADPTSRLKETAVLTVVLDVLAWAAFVYGIGLQVPVWPTFL